MLQKLKEFTAETKDDDKIFSDLIPQDDSDNNDKSRDNIIKYSTFISLLICQTGYNSYTIVHSLGKNPRKKDRYNKKIGCDWE